MSAILSRTRCITISHGEAGDDKGDSCDSISATKNTVIVTLMVTRVVMVCFVMFYVQELKIHVEPHTFMDILALIK